jgi:hypothetical protein
VGSGNAEGGIGKKLEVGPVVVTREWDYAAARMRPSTSSPRHAKASQRGKVGRAKDQGKKVLRGEWIGQ